MHVLWNFQVADAILPEMIVHVLTEAVEHRLPRCPGGLVSVRQTFEHQAEMQHQQVQPAINRVGHPVIAVEDRSARLRHDGAIERLDGGAWGFRRNMLSIGPVLGPVRVDRQCHGVAIAGFGG